MEVVGITTSAEHLPGLDREQVVDEVSHSAQSSAKWKLYYQVFTLILGSCRVDQFAA